MTKEQLQNRIYDALNQSSNGITTESSANALRARLARELTNAIDSYVQEYVQEQIGTRLQEILTALIIASPTGPCIINPSPSFSAFTRTR